MKTLLIATNFSGNAKHAAEYGYLLAKRLKAKIIVCNAVIIPAEAAVSGMVAWPMEESDTLLESSTEELKKLKAHLEQGDHTDTFRPPVTFFTEAGLVKDIINEVIGNRQVDVVIAGTHESGRLSTFLLGNHANDLIATCAKPLLLVPFNAKFKPVNKIAFATDFIYPYEDLDLIYDLITMARPLNADILITHVNEEKFNRMDFQLWIKEFMAELSNKADYPHIYYRPIKSAKTESGLDWLCEHGQIDMLAMAHRNHNFIWNLVNGSHTQKMANHITIPLLMLPCIK
jgi:nucleotide-binding universal stress UspA family protein